MEQFKQFNIEKNTALNQLKRLRVTLGALDRMGMKIGNELSKIDSAINAVESDVLRIALMGAFSDGKTSVIAAWLGRVMSDMNIDMNESSDSLAVYHPDGLPEKCEIIDTPGLFGDKEKEVNGERVMYEDLTKRYISEAHLILYVVDATNPLKESHADIVKWVLRDLNKLSSTIFVINKMDEVTDLTDQTLFDAQAEIKKDNLKAKLQRAANLSPDEVDQLNIVCLASNPNGRGLEFWFGKPERYESRSRINDLKAKINDVLGHAVPEALIAKTGLDVVHDVVGRHVVLAERELGQLKMIAKQNKEESTRIRQDVSSSRRDIKRLAAELFAELKNMENGLMVRLRALPMKDIRVFLEDEIGYGNNEVGYKLALDIKAAIDRFFDQSSKVTACTSQDISRHLDSSENFLNAIGENVLKSMGGAGKAIAGMDLNTVKGGIFAARDVLKNVTGFTVKFKPWEATKLAGSITKWAGPAGLLANIASDFFVLYNENENEGKLQKAKDEIAEKIKGFFKDIYDILRDDEQIIDIFAPEIRKLEELIKITEDQFNFILKNESGLLKIKEDLDGMKLLPGRSDAAA